MLIKNVMTKTPACCRPSDTLDMVAKLMLIGENEKLNAALALMEDKLVRRLPVVDDSGKIVGIVSEADLIARVPTLKVARLVKSVARKTRRPAAAVL